MFVDIYNRFVMKYLYPHTVCSMYELLYVLLEYLIVYCTYIQQLCYICIVTNPDIVMATCTNFNSVGIM